MKNIMGNKKIKELIFAIGTLILLVVLNLTMDSYKIRIINLSLIYVIDRKSVV